MYHQDQSSNRPGRSHDERDFESSSTWSIWYRPGSTDDDQIYDSALKKCREVNDQLNSQPLWSDKRGRMRPKTSTDSSIRFQRHELYSAAWVEELVTKEKDKIKSRDVSESKWRHNVSSFADDVINVANLIKPIVDLFVPSSPEYSVPYACLWVMFQGIASRKEKKESAFGLMSSLSDEIPILEAYGDMFPTDEMKDFLAQFYIHTVDLLWRLAKYHSIGFFKQLTDAILPQTKYDFSMYLENIKRSSQRLKTLCEIGHMAEQKDIKNHIESLHSEVRHLRQYIGVSRKAQAHHYASEVIDTWHDQIGDIESETELWNSVQFFTDMRDHWSQNGIIPCLKEWRERSDSSENSILWISSQSNGRQSWLTEFSVDLMSICQSQGQSVVFAMCDRPGGIKWSPMRVIRQLAAQILINQPGLTVSQPGIFNCRSFRKASSFSSLCCLLDSALAVMKSVLIIIDRLDLCIPDPGGKDENIAQVLSDLVKSHPHSLRVIVTTGKVVPPFALPGLAISFAMVNTRRRPRRRESPPPAMWSSVTSYYYYSDSDSISESDLHITKSREGRPRKRHLY